MFCVLQLEIPPPVDPVEMMVAGVGELGLVTVHPIHQGRELQPTVDEHREEANVE